MSCYYKVGTRSYKTAPCNHTAIFEGKHTSCCEPDTLCLTNGLCRNPDVDTATNYAWRFGCTDETFTDPTCSNYCNNITGDLDNQLTWKCPREESWCCNTGEPGPTSERVNRTNTTCCSISELLFNAPNPTAYTTARLLSFPIENLMSSATASSDLPSSSSASTNLPTTTTTTTTTSSNFTAPPTTKPSSNALAIGLGTGLGAGAAIALGAGLVYFFFFWRRPRKSRVSDSHKVSTEYGRVEVMSNGVSELNCTKEPVEMRGPELPCELGTRTEPVELPSK